MEHKKPLGGVLKETYIHAGGHELTYDLLAGMKADLCSEIKKIKTDTEAIKQHCACRVGQCESHFNKRYIKVAISKGPFAVSWIEIILMAAIAGVMVGIGVIGWDEIFKAAM